MRFEISTIAKNRLLDPKVAQQVADHNPEKYDIDEDGTISSLYTNLFVNDVELAQKQKKTIKEGFEVGDLKNVLLPKLHIDEYDSKVGNNDKNIVLSFLVADKNAAEDLVNFLERGYEFILDAAISPSEIKLGKYLVFVEVLRRIRSIGQILKILSDLSAACGTKAEDWKFSYMDNLEYLPLTKENIKAHVPLSPKAYRDSFNQPINEMRTAAGLPVPTDPVKDPTIKALQVAAGLR